MAAGPWYSSSGLGDSNVALVTKALTVALHESAKNKAPIAHPVMQEILRMDEGIGSTIGALGVQIGLAAIGQGKAAATAEGTEAGATNFSVSNRTLTPSRKEFLRSVSDYGRSLQRGLLTGEIGPDALALLTFEGYSVWTNTLIDLVVANASSATYEAGTTGTALTWADMQDEIYDHKDRGNVGPILAMISAKGAKDLANDAISLGGAVQMASQVQDFLTNGGAGAYVGRFFGDLDLYINSELDTDGGDTLGIAFNSRGIFTKHNVVPFPSEADAILNAGMFRMEARRPGGAVSYISTDMYNAAGILDAKGMFAIRYAT
jgi:hypothetical protein